MKEDIAGYSPLEPSIVAIGDHRIRAFVGDAQAHLDAVLWVGEVPTRIVTLAGRGRVEAIAFDTSVFAVGDPVRVSDETANWPRARAGRTALEALSFEPGAPEASATTSATPSTVQTGIGAIDGLLPLIREGVTMVLDPGAPDACTDKLAVFVGSPLAGAAGRDLPHATHQVLGDSGLALRVALQWAVELGCALQIEAPPFDLDALLDGRTLTTLARINLRDGLEILAETLELGHSDTQIVLHDDGRIDLTRSASRHSPNPELIAELGGLEAAREQLAIFGEHDINDAHRIVIERASHLETHLL